MKIVYYMPFYTGRCVGRHARMHDIFHFLNRKENSDFSYKVYTHKAEYVDSGRICKPALSFFMTHKRNMLDRLLKKVSNFLIKRKLLKEEFNIFHTTVLDSNSILLLKFIKKVFPEKKIVVGPNVMSIIRYGQIEKKELFEYVDAVVSVGEYHKEKLIEFGVPGDKIFCLPPTVDPYYFSRNYKIRKSEKFEILYAGALTKFKGINTFMAALEILKREGVDFRAVVSGEGEYLLDRDKSIDSSVDMTGYTGREKMRDRYLKAHVYVHPGVDEFGPTTIIEALACGTICALSDLPSFREYDKNDSCRYFPVGNAVELAKELTGLYKAWLVNESSPEVSSVAHDKSVVFLKELYQGIIDE